MEHDAINHDNTLVIGPLTDWRRYSDGQLATIDGVWRSGLTWVVELVVSGISINHPDTLVHWTMNTTELLRDWEYMGTSSGRDVLFVLGAKS